MVSEGGRGQSPSGESNPGLAGLFRVRRQAAPRSESLTAAIGSVCGYGSIAGTGPICLLVRWTNVRLAGLAFAGSSNVRLRPLGGLLGWRLLGWRLLSAGAFLAGAFLAGAFLAGAFLAGAFLAAPSWLAPSWLAPSWLAASKSHHHAGAPERQADGSVTERVNVRFVLSVESTNEKLGRSALSTPRPSGVFKSSRTLRPI